MPTDSITRNLTLLLIDDEEVIHKSVGDFLEKMGYTVRHAYNGDEGLALFFEAGADIIISDVKMPGLDGIQLLHALNRRQADVEVILITGHGDLDIAIAALRQGAFDFFNKPVRLEELIASLERTQRYQAMRREKDRIQQRLDALLRSNQNQEQDLSTVGESRAIREVTQLVTKVAQTDRTTVLIQGESGTGKELVARAIHQQSQRAAAPFMSINCTAITETLFESELFGHEKGAFTDAKNTKKGLFELSQGGTLFLDEIGDMSAPGQAKLLRVLEERCIRRVGGTHEIPVDVRLIAATNQNLNQLQAEGAFRQDLYFRLSVFTIDLPPLRNRSDDVLLLAYHFLQRFAAEFHKDITHIEPVVQELLQTYPFPGNVRELRNLLERAVILSDSPTLTLREFADLAHYDLADVPNTDDALLDLAELEANAIRVALKKSNYNQTEAARDLGIGHDALRYRIKKYNIFTG